MELNQGNSDSSNAPFNNFSSLNVSTFHSLYLINFNLIIFSLALQ